MDTGKIYKKSSHLKQNKYKIKKSRTMKDLYPHKMFENVKLPFSDVQIFLRLLY